jgi:hypothetical protein
VRRPLSDGMPWFFDLGGYLEQRSRRWTKPHRGRVLITHLYHSDQPWGQLSNFSRHAVFLRRKQPNAQSLTLVRRAVAEDPCWEKAHSVLSGTLTALGLPAAARAATCLPAE